MAIGECIPQISQPYARSTIHESLASERLPGRKTDTYRPLIRPAWPRRFAAAHTEQAGRNSEGIFSAKLGEWAPGGEGFGSIPSARGPVPSDPTDAGLRRLWARAPPPAGHTMGRHMGEIHNSGSPHTTTADEGFSIHSPRRQTSTASFRDLSSAALLAAYTHARHRAECMPSLTARPRRCD